MQTVAAEPAKRPLATAQHDDLKIAGLAVQRVEHALDPVVIGKDQRIVEDQACR